MFHCHVSFRGGITVVGGFFLVFQRHGFQVVCWKNGSESTFNRAEKRSISIETKNRFLQHKEQWVTRTSVTEHKNHPFASHQIKSEIRNQIKYLNIPQHTVDGRNPAPLVVGSLSHYLQGFVHPRWCRISETSTVPQHTLTTWWFEPIWKSIGVKIEKSLKPPPS